MSAPLRLGIAGLGTVGVGVVKIVTEKTALLRQRTGREIVITAVSARSAQKDRGIDLSPYAWEADPVALAKRSDIDTFIELMGGHEGPAKEATEAALHAGKDVVTANKALLAHHGQKLAVAHLVQDGDPLIWRGLGGSGRTAAQDQDKHSSNKPFSGRSSGGLSLKKTSASGTLKAASRSMMT